MNMKAYGLRKALILLLSVLLVTCAFAFSAAAEGETYTLNLEITFLDDIGDEGFLNIKEELPAGQPIVVEDLIAKYPAAADILADFIKVTDKTVGMPADGLMPAENLTLELYYEMRPFTVTWTANGEIVATENVAYGATPVFKGETPVKAPDAQYTYTFAGWDAVAAPVYSDVTYNALFDSTVNEYTVTWIVEGAEIKVQVPYGTLPTFDGTPTKDADAEYSYVFTGWSPEVVAVTGDATYTAQFSGSHNYYNITWIVDGETVKIDVVEYGVVPSFTPVKENTVEFTYTFSGWDVEPAAVTGHATYTGSFLATRNKYTVTWIVDGLTTTEQVEYGTVPTFTGSTDKAPDAQYTYTFSGWDVEPVAVTGEATYTAQYSKTLNKYTITWIVDGQTTTEQVEYGTVPTFTGSTNKTPDVQYTYTFAGWDVEPAAVTGDATYTAQYNKTLNKYTVTWIVDGVSTNQQVEYGSVPSFDGTPTKAPDAQYTYTFAGWTPAVEAVTGNATYTAVFDNTPNTVSIIFKVDGQPDLPLVVQIGDTPVYPNGTPTKAADAQYTYTFAGWDKEIAVATEDAVYTAQFTKTVNKYTITWIVDGQTTTTEVEYGTVPTFNGSTDKAATAEYTYTFKGWDTTPVAVTGEATYTATYSQTKNKYTITWVVGDKTTTTEVEYGKVPTFSGSTDKASDAQYIYTFKGWDTTPVAVVGNATYTARYDTTLRKYTVIFKYGHNTVLPVIVTYGQAATAPTNTDKAPTAQFTYTFDGWDVDFSNITGNLTVTAKYTETVRSYTVTFKFGDGKTETVTVEYGKAATAPTDTDKAATDTATYTFKEWDADFSEVTADITVNAIYEETPIVVPPTVNTEALQAVIDAYKSAGLDVSAEALTKAEAALNDSTLSQEDIDALVAALQAAIDESKETEPSESDTSEPDTNEPEDPTDEPTAAPTEPVEDPTEDPTESETDVPVPAGCGNAWIWIVVVIVVVGAGAAVVIILLRRKNATDPEPTEPTEAEPEIEAESEVEEVAEPETPAAPLFIPLGEEIPEEEVVIPEEIDIVEEVSVEDADTLMSDKVAEAFLVESEELGGNGKMGIINVGVISAAYQSGEVVDLASLQAKGMIDGNVGRLKVLASGTLDKPLTIKADAFSVQAIKMITLTGGHAIHLGGGK